MKPVEKEIDIMRNITGVLIDVRNETAGVTTIPDTLEAYYDALHCDCIDIVMRTIGGRAFDIVCDDEGLLKDEPKVSAVNDLGEPMLVGNLFICKSEDGELISLSEDEREYVMDHVQHMFSIRHPEGYPMLTHLDYF